MGTYANKANNGQMFGSKFKLKHNFFKKRGKMITFTLKVTHVEIVYDIASINLKKEQKISDLEQRLNEYQENKENVQQINDLREKLNAKQMENERLIVEKAQINEERGIKEVKNKKLIKEKAAYQK